MLAANDFTTSVPVHRPNDIARALALLPEGGDVDEAVLGSAFLVSPYAQFILDWSGRILICNRRAERTFWPEENGSPEAMRGVQFSELTVLPSIKIERMLREGTARGTMALPMRGKNQLRPPEGTTFRVSLLRSASRGERLILLTQDQLKSTAEALSSMNARRIEAREELERLGTAHLELQAAMATMEAFSRAASHDLKTPLNTLTVGIDLLLRKYQTDLPAPALQYLDVMKRAVAQMDQLTSELLDHARSSARVVSAEPLNLRREIEHICTDMAALFEDCAANVSITGNGFDFMAEPLLFRVLVSNLLSNAIKYRDPNRRLSIRIELIGDTQKSGSFRVSDNGIGFDPAKADAIFSPFERLETLTDGTGLGLSTCREICRRHGWSIEATSTAGAGAAFAVAFT